MSYPPPYHGHYRQPPVSPGPYPPQQYPQQPQSPAGYYPPTQQYAPQPYPQQQYAQPPMIRVAPTSGWAAASLVLGLIGLFGGWCAIGIPCILAVVAGHIGLKETQDGSRGGRGMAVAGLILGYLVVIPAVLIFFTVGGLGVIGSTVPDPTGTP
ncbi:protein of unknown function [Actinoplanes philippinensis]|uniref:DUF4190 domain-containing protein n=1 Tax=Actinoplanes philippinensis TaxID=35752 RepID=A0A1I2BA58_9ACTN|nr:protein of unknown function [Actinoplanes philippinensis]